MLPVATMETDKLLRQRAALRTLCSVATPENVHKHRVCEDQIPSHVHATPAALTTALRRNLACVQQRQRRPFKP